MLGHLDRTIDSGFRRLFIAIVSILQIFLSYIDNVSVIKSCAWEMLILLPELPPDFPVPLYTAGAPTQA
jgi:hypothetical protein